MRGVAPLTALALALLLAVPEPSFGDREQELESLREAIDEHRERIESFERQQRGLLEALEAIDRTVVELERDAARHESEAQQASRDLREVEDRVEALEARLGRTRSAMSARALALYKTGEVGPVQVLFSSTSLSELLERVDALRLLLDHDRRLVVRFETQRAELERAHAEARQAGQRHREAVERLAQRRRALDRERATKRDLVARVRGDRARERAVLGELEVAAQALEETLARLGRDSDSSVPSPAAPGSPGSFEQFRGRLRPPVDAPIVRAFGRVVDGEFRTQIFRKGVDFGAQRGQPVRAVAAGRARFAGWFRGYGRMVILEHGDGFFTVSGHLDEIAVEIGDAVSAGQAIGTVGDTGSLSGPRLYFEVRHGGKAVDPAEWLVAVPPGRSAGLRWNPFPSAG